MCCLLGNLSYYIQEFAIISNTWWLRKRSSILNIKQIHCTACLPKTCFSISKSTEIPYCYKVASWNGLSTQINCMDCLAVIPSFKILDTSGQIISKRYEKGKLKTTMLWCNATLHTRIQISCYRSHRFYLLCRIHMCYMCSEKYKSEFPDLTYFYFCSRKLSKNICPGLQLPLRTSLVWFMLSGFF